MTVAVLRSARNLLVAATTVVALLTAPTAASSADTVPGSPAYDLAGACVLRLIVIQMIVARRRGDR